VAIPDLLTVWLSPSFPTGAFAFSHGLEKAVEDNLVRDAGSLAAWLTDVLTVGSLWNDLVLLAAAWRAARAGDETAFGDIADLALALQPSAERHLETVTQGNAFAAAIAAAWPAPLFGRLAPAGDVAYPIAVGLAAAAHSLALAPTLLAYGLAFISNLTSAAIRLSVVGQTDAQQIIAALMAGIRATALKAEASTIGDIGGAVFACDLASLRHETQYTRLFRS
jgi:urease accessory protein